ncbi:unnamed protein product [Rotaria magnacalcarata]|uniref:Reverse transcriptase n=1 Tax=Rotaria magnacalcarata TaxID=392030 RepID=A0A819ZAE1_9BILA|nr:unnamed protein product [Rotaria magnacalcarata]CAF4169024.1 unnamed protein product [Rotaria magnacalcarata]
MIKEIPEHFHVILPHAYSQLFSAVNWDNEWKLARTICLNKSDNPVPTTNQLRPISMLPVFSKVYEKLFLLRFNRWTIKMNILPDQQSGARPHQQQHHGLIVYYRKLLNLSVIIHLLQ